MKVERLGDVLRIELVGPELRLLRRALRIAATYALDVKLVSYGPPAPEIVEIAREFG